MKEGRKGREGGRKEDVKRKKILCNKIPGNNCQRKDRINKSPIRQPTQ